MKRVVGDRSLPDQVPQRVHRLSWISGADGLVQRAEERRAAVAQHLEDRGLAFGEIIRVRLKPDTTDARSRF